MRNSKVLKPEIILLDKSYATNAIEAGLKKKNIRLESWIYSDIRMCFRIFVGFYDSLARDVNGIRGFEYFERRSWDFKLKTNGFV